jgi:DMSO reductase anchor subunit
MLVLTQLSVGAFCFDTLLRVLFPANFMTRLSAVHALVAMALGLLAIAASTLHLGRPFYAWRALIGLKTSWLSREILLFGIFAALAMMEACSFWLKPIQQFLSIQIAICVSLAGLAGVTSSWMVYHITRRPLWRGAGAAAKFFGTTALLGSSTILFVTTLQALLSPAIASNGAYRELTACLTEVLAGVTVLKLIIEGSIFLRLRRREPSPLKNTALLLLGELVEMASARLFVGLLGGVILPLAFLFQHPSPGFATLGVTFWIMLCTLLGELLERHLFFVSVSAPRMPGGV